MKHVRPSWRNGPIESMLPLSVQALMSAYRMAPKGAPELYIEIPIKPPSANKIYRKSSYKDKVTGKIKPLMFTDKAVDAFREMTTVASWGKSFSPRGVAAAVIVIESPWVTKEYSVRKADIDNPIKCLLDALVRSINLPDELLWEVHSAKMFSRREATHVWLFDLGDVVTARGGV